MTFKLSQRSLSKLEGVDERLVAVVKYAITETKIDFGVICGLRTIEEQRKLVAKGASQTMRSRHIDGEAVDLMAFVGSRASWELALYHEIAEAMRKGAEAVGVGIVWGCAWHIPNICSWEGSMEDAMNDYVDLRRSQHRSAFLDGPHFQLSD
jgi:peptidoglycan L-alanyl-D-glutamate endopeptidase CwlK